MEITIDEWIVHFISDPQKQETAFQLLEKIFQKCDKLVAVSGGGLAQKIWWMSKASATWAPASQMVAKYFFRTFLTNSNKFHLFDESELSPLPADMEQETPPDDRYLARTAMNTQDRFILTTDGRLKDKLAHRQELTICLVDEFLQQYVSQ